MQLYYKRVSPLASFTSRRPVYVNETLLGKKLIFNNFSKTLKHFKSLERKI